jgi:hypothetical protein
MDLYTRLSENPTHEVESDDRRLATYETKVIETIDEERTSALLGSLGL